MLDQTQLRKGAIISYVLLPSQQPTDPQKQWYGKVTQIFRTASGSIFMLMIESLVDGYEGYTEFVALKQIRGIHTHVDATQSI